MFAHDQTLAHVAPAARATVALPPLRLLQAMSVRLMAWAKTCSDYYAAAALYDQLSALSEAELTRRGLSRATLARDVCAAYDRP